MPRRIVYGISLWAFLAAAACTIAAIALPTWISYTAPTDNDPIRVNYGLHKRCSSVTGECVSFPEDKDCEGGDRSFCSIWRSAGFAMNLSVIMEIVVLVAYIVIIFGGRVSRESGWKILSGLLAVVAAGQIVSTALVAYLFDHDNRFFPGWFLDRSWILCTVSWSVLLVNAFAVIGAALFMPREDDYEPIPDSR